MSQAGLQQLQDPERLATLRRLAILDTPCEAEFDRLTSLASRALQAPAVLTCFVDADRHFFKSCLGLPEPWLSRREAPLTHSLCQYAVARGKPLVTGDARDDPRLCCSAGVRELGMIAYAGIPLIAEGYALGTFCAVDYRPRSWSEEELSVLRDLAAVTMSELMRHAQRSERAQLKRALRIAQAEADRASQAKSRFLSHMSHELRTPLNAILGFAQLLEIDDLSEEQRESVEQILRGGRQLLKLVNEVLDIAYLQAGSLAPALEPVAVQAVLEEALLRVRARAAQRSIRIRRRSLCTAARYAQADRRKLLQVILNVLISAITYSATGGELGIFCTMPSDQCIRITIQASRCGRAPGQQAHLCTPGEPQSHEQSDRLEVGLALCESVVEAMGGAMGVEAEAGAGNTCWIELVAVR